MNGAQRNAEEQEERQRYYDGLPAQVADLERQLAQVTEERDAAIAKHRTAMLALESLTPGGSEYVGDVESCLSTANAIRTSQHRVIVRMKRERDAAETQLAELKRVVEPFVKLAQQLPADVPESPHVMPDCQMETPWPSTSEWRALVAAFPEENHEQAG